jgi:hypothetical protein
MAGWAWRILIAMAPLMAGCAAVANDSSPGTLTWLDYIGGEDLRRTCAEGRPDRFRLVLNADIAPRVRTYDLMGEEEGGAVIDVNDFAAETVAAGGPFRSALDRRENTLSAHLDAETFAEVRFALAMSGAFTGGEEGARLPADGFYWLASGCQSGRWFFSAYPYPADRFKEADLVSGRARLRG